MLVTNVGCSKNIEIIKKKLRNNNNFMYTARGLNFQQFKVMQLKTEKAMLAAGNTPAIKEAPSQDGKAIQDNQEDTEHLSSSSK